MALVRNCLLPSDLLYDVPTNIWVRELDDGMVEIGMTDIAQTLAGSIIHCRPKKVGKKVKKMQMFRTWWKIVLYFIADLVWCDHRNSTPFFP